MDKENIWLFICCTLFSISKLQTIDALAATRIQRKFKSPVRTEESSFEKYLLLFLNINMRDSVTQNLTI